MNLSRESPNSRLNIIRKFLGQAPPEARRLRLLIAEDTPLPLGEWLPLAAGEARELLAGEIEQLCLDTAAERSGNRVGFLLAWCDEGGAQKTVRQLTVYAHQLVDGTRPEDTARALDGSTPSQLAQTQRHLEAMMRMHLHWESSTFATLTSTIDRLSERVAHMETHSGKRHDEVLELKEVILGLENANPDELTPAQSQVFELIKEYAPRAMTLMQYWAQHQQAAQQKQKPKPNGAAAAADEKAA